MHAAISLKAKTIFFALVPIVLMLVIGGIIWFYGFGRIARDVVFQRDTELARITAGRMAESLRYYSQNLQSIASDAYIQSMDTGLFPYALKKTNNLYDVFDAGLLIYDSSGAPIWSFDGKNKTAFSVAPEFNIIKNTFMPFFSDVLWDSSTGRDVIIIGVPIIDNNGNFRGVLAGMASVKYSFLVSAFSRALETKAGGSGYAYMVDGKGKVLYHRYSSWIGGIMTSSEAVKKVINGESGALQTTDQLGERVILGFAPVPGTRWGIITHERWDVIAKPIRIYSIILLVLLLGGCALSGILVFTGLGRTIIRPILDLAHASRRIAEDNNYSVRIEEKREDEIGYLYDGFNSMLEGMQNRERERDAAEKKLLETRNLLKNAINAMSSIIISIDEGGTITQWNNAAAGSTGIDADNAVGKSLWELMPVFSKYRISHAEVIRNMQPMEFYRESFGGFDNKFYNVYLYPLVSNGSEGTLIRLDDITELDKVEMELRQIQKMESIGLLAGGFAHDFNNVLMGITGTLSLVEYKLNKQEPFQEDELKDFVGMMLSSSRRAADLVQQLLSLARKQELSFSPVDLNSAIKHVMNICENTFDKSIELKPVYHDKNAMVNADPGQIEQVLLNLCVNAGHAMTIMRDKNDPRGGVLTVEIERITADNHFCSIHPEAKEIEYWTISVSDTGVGMDGKTMAKIFDPYFSTKEKGKGTGLGLPIVYGIIKQHNGFIDVYSEKGIGSTFKVFLPVIHQGIVEGTTPDEKESIPTGEGLILLVDDEEPVRLVARAILEKCGYTVMCAVDGQEGVNMFKKHHSRIKAVVLDLVMPKKSGLDAYIEMKKIDNKARVLIASGFKQDERIEAALKLGAQGCIQKPFTMESLAKSIHAIVHA